MAMSKQVNRRLIGKQAQMRGEIFEQRIDAMARYEGVSCTRVPDGCKQRFGKLIRIKSPFDFILSYQNRIALIDCKVRGEDKLYKSDITEHQVQELIKHRQAAVTGYLVYHYMIDAVRFYPAIQMATGSMDGVDLGSLQQFRVKRLFEIAY
jgi:Holliday junction resolvase